MLLVVGGIHSTLQDKEHAVVVGRRLKAPTLDTSKALCSIGVLDIYSPYTASTGMLACAKNWDCLWKVFLVKIRSTQKPTGMVLCRKLGSRPA